MARMLTEGNEENEGGWSDILLRCLRCLLCQSEVQRLRFRVPRSSRDRRDALSYSAPCSPHPASWSVLRSWMFDVRCWMFGSSTIFHLPSPIFYSTSAVCV